MLGIGGALGLPLAGLLADNVDYHALFWIGAVGAVVSAVAVLSWSGAPRRSGGSIDLAGMVLLAGGLVCLVLPLPRPPRGAGARRAPSACWSRRWCCSACWSWSSAGSSTRWWTCARWPAADR